jgi:peptidoglycan-associated lipoprotein
MRARAVLAALLIAAIGSSALAQIRLPVIFPLGRSDAPPPPNAPVAPMSAGALQADLVVKSGSDTVYFAPRGSDLDANAMATLRAQARWLLANPFVLVRLEGHGGPRDSRDYALAIGDRRANAVRDFLVLQGIAPQRISVISWGKERPGSVRIGPSIVAAGPRVVTTVQPPAFLQPLPAPVR